MAEGRKRYTLHARLLTAVHAWKCHSYTATRMAISPLPKRRGMQGHQAADLTLPATKLKYGMRGSLFAYGDTAGTSKCSRARDGQHESFEEAGKDIVGCMYVTPYRKDKLKSPVLTPLSPAY